MPEQEQSSNETDSTPEDLVSYEGRVDNFFRHRGIEEGAHAVYGAIKSTKKSEIETTEQPFRSAQEVGGEKAKAEGLRILSYPDKNIEDLTDDDILSLIDYNDETTPPIIENRRRAQAYCRDFIDGALVPVKEIFKGNPSQIKFGLAVTPKDAPAYDFHYDSGSNTVLINKDSLQNIAKYPPDYEVTSKVSSLKYQSQDHERRALTWRINDARKHGLNDLADALKKTYDATKK